jgi:hypothetical protein
MKTAAALLLACLPAVCAAQAEAPASIFEKISGAGASTQWSDYLADTAEGSVSASGMLGIAGDSVHAVQNVRDVVVALKGLSSNDSKTAMGFSITPARTSLAPMDLATYARSWPARLLGSLSFGYAQGNASVGGTEYERRAVSVETSLFLHSADDPVIAYVNAVARAKPGESCQILGPSKPEGPPGAQPPAAGAGATGPVKPAEAPKEEADEARARAAECRARVLNALRWNRSQLSASFATAWIKSDDGSVAQTSLGRMAVLGFTYGFDEISFMRDNSALSIAVRRTLAEPVLETLQAASIERRDGSLATLRFSAGSSRLRALVEASNAKSAEITASQRVFKRAIGIDLRVSEGMWLNFRLGQQRRIDGTGNEVGSLFSLSYSPSALLGR